ncbi:hypothetical protein BP5796_01757 [Coleophoma crateriformis]|uniref:ATP synthase subunit 9, mitochondrial n=1 Tax=Coleophoma crateriformis TaxID=565419 RepID=A0A3D8T1C0_9HELO|nr:hypothetical protein BP5796_01757 [Coleophoma crateriformis]
MASRIIAPKMASMMGQTIVKSARPMVRSNLNIKSAQRGFSGVSQSLKAKTSPFASMKRQQISILNRVALSKQSRPYSSEIASAMVQVSQNMGMGSAAIGLGGAGIGIGLVFAALIMAVARNPSMRGQLFQYAILGFAFVEAIGLFDLMVAMMCKYV